VSIRLKDAEAEKGKERSRRYRAHVRTRGAFRFSRAYPNARESRTIGRLRWSRDPVGSPISRLRSAGGACGMRMRACRNGGRRVYRKGNI